MHKSRNGLFLTFEGIDGCGKTTQAMLTYKFLVDSGFAVTLLREPGSTEVAERIRSILLDRRLEITDRTELLLYEAARADLTEREIVPVLNRGQIILCDRFYDSTTAYQGFGRRLDVTMVRGLHRVAVGAVRPDLTFVFDLDVRTAATRRSGSPDRLEAQSQAFFERVRRGFLEIARKERRRVKVIDASQPAEAVFEDVKKYLTRRLKSYEPRRSA